MAYVIPAVKASAILQPFVDAGVLVGAVALVADQAKVLSVEVAGYADLAGGKPMRGDEVFWIASMTKPITATLVMMLVDEGKLGLDDAVEKFIPEFKDMWVVAESDDVRRVLKRPGRAMTVRDLLRHTSGMNYCSAMEVPTFDGMPLEIAVRSYAMTPLGFQPGEKSQYSNMGINTAGRIVEIASGMSYEAFLDDRLVKPLGMKDTTFWPSTAQLVRLAKGYKPNAEKTKYEETTISQLRYPLSDRTRHPLPAGGLFSTAVDLARYCQMFLCGGTFEGRRYLKAESVAEMARRQPTEALGNFGVGWEVIGGIISHGGAMATNMRINPKSGSIVVYMVQNEGFVGNGAEGLQAVIKAADAGMKR